MKGMRLCLACAVLSLVTGCVGPSPLSVEPTAIPTLAPAALPTEPVITPTSPPPTPDEIAPEEPASVEPTPVPPAPAEPAPVESHVGLPLPTDRGELFSASGACAICHTNMRDESGADVSIDTFWRSTMMANASRDPYWQASVREEALDQPAYQPIIEDTCAKCHTPMARFTAAASGGAGELLDTGFLDAGHEHHVLALDGVSCTLCHQIEEDSFGEADSFSGGYAIDADLPVNERLNYGPFLIGQAQAAVMQVASGFIPVGSPHVEQSELCATCHTLYTPYIDANGEVGGIFPEQTPYLEWKHSDYRDVQACQDCHMPAAQGGVRLSTTGGPPRGPFSQHVFVGGNVYMLGTLSAFGEELGVTTSSEHFEHTVGRAMEQLQNRTLTLAVEEVAISGTELRVIVSLQSLVGHKFPAGFPSRRVWLHVTVRDGSDEVVFESGAVNPDGSIVGNDNDAAPDEYEPHYPVIVSPDQVQIYEPIIRDSEGRVTTALLRAAEYIKDNRLLPSGFDKQAASEDVAVYGEALEDTDFVGGGDRLEYAVELGDAKGPFVVSVELLYQSIGYRWAENMRRHEAPEITRFLDYYEAIPNLPVVIASATVKVEN